MSSFNFLLDMAAQLCYNINTGENKMTKVQFCSNSGLVAEHIITSENYFLSISPAHRWNKLEYILFLFENRVTGERYCNRLWSTDHE